jgi:hypothetical protein
MTDQGDFPIEEKRKANEEIDKLSLDKQDAAWDKFFATHRHDAQRLALGRSPDGSVGLQLRDGAGRVRIVLAVQANGKPVLQFLDGQGTVIREFATTEK